MSVWRGWMLVCAQNQSAYSRNVCTGTGGTSVGSMPLWARKASKVSTPSSIQMPVGAGAQQHPLRHVLPPEAHRISNDERLDPTAFGVCGRRQPVGPGADHQQRDVGDTFLSCPAGVDRLFHASNYGLMDARRCGEQGTR